MQALDLKLFLLGGVNQGGSMVDAGSLSGMIDQVTLLTSHQYVEQQYAPVRATCASVYSFICLFARACTHSLSHSLPQSFAHSIIRSLARWRAHSLTHSLTHSLSHSLLHSLNCYVSHPCEQPRQSYWHKPISQDVACMCMPCHVGHAMCFSAIACLHAGLCHSILPV